MDYQLVTAKTNASTELLLLVDDKIVSHWPYDPEDLALKNVGDLRDWDNQLAAGHDLSNYQVDYDNDVLQLERLLVVQCTAAEFVSNYEVSNVLYRQKELSFDSILSPDYDGSLSLKDHAECWGTIDLTNKIWFWDKKSGNPKLSDGEEIMDLKIIANDEGEFLCNGN